MIRINQNIKNLKPSATLAIHQKIGQLRDQGHTIYHFGFGQSPFPVHKKIVQALIDNAHKNSYLPSAGLPELREVIGLYLKNYHKVVADPEYIFIGPGSKELLYQTILILEGTFLIPQGSWVSYLPQINSKGGKFAILNTSFENNYKLSVDELSAYCKINPSDQKILLLNSPNNPTGAVYSSEELRSIAEVCRKHGIIVLSDEIYSLLNFQGGRSPSIGEYYQEKSFVFGGLSKIFSGGGYRLGFMALPTDLHAFARSFESLFSETFSAVASPVQYAACEAFALSKEVLEEISNHTEILKYIANYTYHELTAVDVKCTKPQGGFYILIDLENYRVALEKRKLFSSQKIAKYLLEEHHIALLPGSDFYFEEFALTFRLAYVDFDGRLVNERFLKNRNLDPSFLEKYCPHIVHGIKKLKSVLIDLS